MHKVYGAACDTVEAMQVLARYDDNPRSGSTHLTSLHFTHLLTRRTRPHTGYLDSGTLDLQEFAQLIRDLESGTLREMDETHESYMHALAAEADKQYHRKRLELKQAGGLGAARG